MAELLQRRTNRMEPGIITDCAITTVTKQDVMMAFRSELQDVMTTLLENTVLQIVQLVQKDFWETLKQNEQEIHGLHMKLQRLATHPQGKADDEIVAVEETVQERTRSDVEQLDRETETHVSTDEPVLRQELTGNGSNTENSLEIIQINQVGNAENVVEAAEAGTIPETGSETFQSDMGAVVQFKDSRGQDGSENQSEKEGQQARRKRKRVRVKSEKEDGDLMNERTSSVEEVVVLKWEDPEIERSESHQVSESIGGAEHQVHLLEDNGSSCNGNAVTEKNLHELKLPTSQNESTAQDCFVVTESKLSEGITRNRCISPLATYSSRDEISEEYLAKAKVALTKMEDLPDKGWVLLDPLTGKFCIKDELDFKAEGIETDEQDGDAAEGPSFVPSRSGIHSVGTASNHNSTTQTTTNSSTQTEAQITVTMTEDDSDKIEPNSTFAAGKEPNRVVTRSSKSNRAGTSNTKTNEPNDAQSQRGYATRSSGNAVSDSTEEGVESGASCPTGSTQGKKVHSDSGKGNVRLTKEVVIICSKVQSADAKKHPNIASTSKQSLTESDKASGKNIGKGKRQSRNTETRVYRSGHFVISQGSLTKNKTEVTMKSSGQLYSASVKVCDASEQGPEVKNEFHPKGKLFECKHCAKTFPNLKYLKKHWEYHSGKKKHFCTHCGKGFVYECHLRIHMQSHTNDRPFQCNQCGKRFIYRSNLKYHLLYHTGEKPHVCLQCGMAFSRRGHLVKHITCHSGLRPYCCSHCGKTFTAKGGLTRHERIHQKKSKTS